MIGIGPDGVGIGSWRKSSRSSANEGDCVELAPVLTGGALVRDTKQNGTGPVLTAGAAGWGAFLTWVKDGAEVG